MVDILCSVRENRSVESRAWPIVRRGGAVVLAAVAMAGCVTTGAQPSVTPPVPVVTWEQKLSWMMRLEDQRIVRDPNPPPPSILQPATRRTPVVYAPPPPSDLIRLLDDEEARVRRRAALALGRVGLAEAIEPLSRLVATDPDVEVRQMAAFALGLIGEAAARPALLAALTEAPPLVQGRAAEALSLIGERGDAVAIAAMVRAHVDAGALTGVEPDDLTSPLAPPVEAVRLGLYALGRIGTFDTVAPAVLDTAGQPVSRWWPVAFALQRINDVKAAPALQALLATPGRYTAAFAARGLAGHRPVSALPELTRVVDEQRAPAAVIVQALRGIVAAGGSGNPERFLEMSEDAAIDPSIRVEALAAFTALATGESVDLLLELVSDRAPALRVAAVRALARLDADTFLTALAGLETDRDWTVRVAQAGALGAVGGERAAPVLRGLLADRDQRVVPAAIAAVAAGRIPGAEALLVDLLKADDFVVRGAAASALAELKAVNAVPALVDAFRGAVGDSAYGARASIVAAIHALSPQTARPLLQESLVDRDWAMRVRALTLLRQTSPADAAPESIRPAFGGRPIDEAEWQAIVTPRFSPHAFIETDKGTIEIELAVLDAPLTAANFVALARRGFFNGLPIHRVVGDFVVQGGDPRGDGEGGPGYTIRDEINQRPYLRGTVGMALDWEDTGGSQFFITHSPQPHLDARYTVFGHVVSGMDVVDRIVPWDVIRSVRIWDGVSPQ